MGDCMYCVHHAELRSLRSTVQRYESSEPYKLLEKEIKSLKYKLSRSESDCSAERAGKKLYRGKYLSAKCDLTDAECRVEELLHKLEAKDQEIARLNCAVQDLNGTIQKLTSQINRDYTNSSIPSSKDENHRKISNSRRKTERKPGAQHGHRGSRIESLPPTAEPVFLPAPPEILESSEYYKTGNIIRKQIIDLSVSVDVIEYCAEEYRSRLTGARKHARFPDGVNNPANYGPNVKAAAFLLNSFCNVSLDKTAEFIRSLTGGRIKLSKGTLYNLGREFSAKTEEERSRLFAAMMKSPVMYVDATVGRVSGKNDAVFHCGTKNEVLYYARDSKGIEGIKNTPIEEFQFTLIHDHDATFYRYGGSHQECLVHVLRYLQDSIENEPNLLWSKQMKSHLGYIIHTVKSGQPLSETLLSSMRSEYDRILDTAEDEYLNNPPGKYYRDGFNLCRRLRKYADSHLYFLSHPEVDYTNNLSERNLRAYKRKQKQAVSFRSQSSQTYYCNALSILKTCQLRGINIFDAVKNTFDYSRGNCALFG